MRLWLTLLLWALPVLASAQDLLDYKLKPAAEAGKGSPQVTLVARTDFRSVELLCSRDGGTAQKFSGGAMKEGQSKAFSLSQAAGEARWDCTGKGFYGTGADEFFDLPISFSGFVGPALSVAVDRNSIDRDGQRFLVRSNREVSRAHLTVTGPDGPFFDEDVSVETDGDALAVGWTGSDELIKFEVTLQDRWGFTAFEAITPWSLEIPHEDVEFDSGQHTIRTDQQRKIDLAAEEISKVVERYGKYVQIKLFIGGYTDTVGSNGDNQALSERRARAIAAALRAKGFAGPLYYQGFGEDALVVGTGDNVDMPANRRAVYLLAADPPAGGQNFPRGAWRAL